jgi:hypothetical protein
MRSRRRDARADRGAGDALQMRRGLAMPDPAGSQAPREQSAIGYAMDALLRPAGRRALSALALVLCLGGAGMFGYPLFTDVYAIEVLQDQLEDRYASLGFKQQYVTRTVKHGDPLTRVVIPSLRVTIGAVVTRPFGGNEWCPTGGSRSPAAAGRHARPRRSPRSRCAGPHPQARRWGAGTACAAGAGGDVLTPATGPGPAAPPGRAGGAGGKRWGFKQFILVCSSVSVGEFLGQWCGMLSG